MTGEASWIDLVAKLAPVIGAIIGAVIAVIGLPLVLLNTQRALAEKKKLRLELDQSKTKQDVVVAPQFEYFTTGPLTISAVLKGDEHQAIGDAYPTGDEGVHFKFNIFNPTKFDFLVHEVYADVLAYAPLNLDHLIHGVGAEEVFRHFKATICPELGSYLATYVPREPHGEFVSIQPNKWEAFDVEITADTEGLYDVGLRVRGGFAGKACDVSLDSPKQRVAFFDKGAGYMVDPCVSG